MTSKSQETPSVAEEMRSLLDALVHKVGTSGKQQHVPATCNWCPVCASLALLRGQRPELAVRAAEHAAGLLAVFRAAMQEHDAHEHAHEHAHRPGPAEDADQDGSAERATPAEPATPAGSAEPTARQRVQKIELRRPGGAGASGPR